MAASDAAFSRAFNSREETIKRDNANAKAETRQQTQDERSDILFNRSTSLFEQQQRFLKDDRALAKYGRDANRAVAMFKSSGGQVFQPMLDLYKSLPDGGQFKTFRRSDDGSFDYEIEWQGQTFKKKGATFDEVGNMMMSISNPAQYIANSGAAAAAQQKHEDAKEIARIKKGIKPRHLIQGTNLTIKEYDETRKGFSADYFKLRSERADDPEDASLNNNEFDEESKSFGILTLSEYIDQEFAKIGINVAGAVIDEEGEARLRPTINAAVDTPVEIMAFFNDSRTGDADSLDAFEFTIEAMVENDRFDEAEDFAKQAGLQQDPDVAKRVAKVIAAGRAKAASKAGADAAAKAKDLKEGIDIVGDDDEVIAKGASDTPVSDPVAAFAANNKPATLADAAKDIGAVLSAISKGNKVLRDKNDRKKAVKLWKEISGGNPKRGSEAFKLLSAAQTPEGLAKLSELYSDIRPLLSPALQVKLDPAFKGQADTRLASDRQSPGAFSNNTDVSAP